MQQIKGLNEQLSSTNESFIKLFLDNSYKDPHLTKKHYSSLVSKIYIIMQEGTLEQKLQRKELLLNLFKNYCLDLINQMVLPSLEKTHNDKDFASALCDQWANFKRFTFYYYALLQYANSHYETAFKIYKARGFSNTITDDKSVYPIPAIAMYYFQKHVLMKFQSTICREIIKRINHIRPYFEQQLQELQRLLEIVWCCGLCELARMKSMSQALIIYQQKNIEILNSLVIQQHYQDYISRIYFNELIFRTTEYYNSYLSEQISIFTPLDQMAKIHSICMREEEFARNYFHTNLQRQTYLETIYRALIAKDLGQRLEREDSLRALLFSFELENDTEIQEQIKMVFQVLKRQLEISIPLLEQMLMEVIMEKGQLINKKINKRKEHISEMIKLKLATNHLIDNLMERNIKLCYVRDRTFRNLLDGLEVSRNLAEYADWTIKECIKLKLQQSQAQQKIKPILLLLVSLSAQDSFLIHHQQFLSRRLIESINQPKLEIEILMLRKLAEHLGSVSVAPHFSMLKDIQRSIEITEKYNAQLPFSNFKWNLRIINSTVWPESLFKTKLKITLPFYLQKQAQAIGDLYHTDNQSGFLKWRLQKGFSLFSGVFKTGKYRFQAENFYMLTLFHIAQQPEHKILFANLAVLIKQVGQEQSDILQNIVKVLVENKLVLREDPQVLASLHPGQQLKINSNYSPSGNRPNQTIIIKPSMELHKRFQKSTVELNKIMKDREKLVEAVLVKLLKHSHATGNNKISYKELYQGVRKHERLKMFNVQESVIKQRLQDLVSREYAERDSEDRRVYRYIA